MTCVARIEATAYCDAMLISGYVISINRPAPCPSWRRRMPVGMLEVTTGMQEVGREGGRGASHGDSMRNYPQLGNGPGLFLHIPSMYACVTRNTIENGREDAPHTFISYSCCGARSPDKNAAPARAFIWRTITPEIITAFLRRCRLSSRIQRRTCARDAVRALGGFRWGKLKLLGSARRAFGASQRL